MIVRPFRLLLAILCLLLPGGCLIGAEVPEPIGARVEADDEAEALRRDADEQIEGARLGSVVGDHAGDHDCDENCDHDHDHDHEHDHDHDETQAGDDQDR